MRLACTDWKENDIVRNKYVQRNAASLLCIEILDENQNENEKLLFHALMEEYGKVGVTHVNPLHT